MPIDNLMQAKLKSKNPLICTDELIKEAHDILLKEKYEFIGYHGTNYASLQSIVPYNFNTSFIGTGSGTERGYGLYVSWNPELAEEHADSSTQSGDPQPPYYDTPRYSDDRGESRILRVYIKDFSSMILGVDYKWGIQSTSGDANGDLNITTPYGQSINNMHDLELIFSASSFKKLAAIPSLINTDVCKKLNENRAQWGYHTIDENSLLLLAEKQPEWFPYVITTRSLLRRVNSDPNALSNQKKWILSNITSQVSFQVSGEQYYQFGIKQAEKDMKKATQYYMLAAIQGHAAAHRMMGNIYTYGTGVDYDVKEAIRFYILAIEHGDIEALTDLGHCCQKGHGVPKNWALAQKIYGLANDIKNTQKSGVLTVQNELETTPKLWTPYFNHYLNPPNMDLAYLARKQYKEDLYEKGHDCQIKGEQEKAKEYFIMAVDLDHAKAQVALGDIYQYGVHADRDPHKAFILYHSAAQQGNPMGLSRLARCYAEGIGVEKDLELFEKYRKLASSLSYPGRSGPLVLYSSKQ